MSSVADALSLFGNDGTCHRITGDSIDGAALDANPSLTRAGICRITYEDDHLDEHPVGRHLNPRRPHAVAVDSETGIVTALEFGANQRQVATEEGLRVESRRADMLERYGDDFELEEGERLDRYRYAAGIEVWIGRESDQVEGFRVVPAEPKASIAGRVGSELDDMAGVLINLTALRAIASEPTFDPALPKPATLPGVGPVLPARSELTLRVGHGIAAIVLHESTVEDVLAFYGTDCRCSSSGRDALPGDAALDRGDLPIWRISYAYDREGEYQPGRPENRTRPCDYFVDSVSRRIQTIKIGVYQKELRTAEGLGVYSRLADVLALYGPPDHSSPGDPIDTHVYDRGLTVCVDRESEDVISLELTRARGRDEPSRLGAPRESEGRA
ncbi:MAG: hypothetical protein R3A51_18150 [Nannocystaceae bacterium]